MDGAGIGDRFGAVFLAVGVLVVVTLVALPFVGRFFAAALAGGVVVAGAILCWRARARH